MSKYVETSKLLKEKIVTKSQIINDLGISRPTLDSIEDMSGNPGVNMLDCIYDYLILEKKHRAVQKRKCKK